jgi:CRP-like cAMP-binding protein
MEIGFLRNHPLTFGLKAEQLRYLGTILESVELAPGDQILGEGVPAKGLFIFSDGKLVVTQRAERGGGSRALAELEAPTVVGEIELVTASPAGASVAAATVAKGALLTADAFGRLVEAGDPAVTKILRNIARVLAQRLLATNKRVGSLVASGKQAELAAMAGDLGHTWNP